MPPHSDPLFIEFDGSQLSFTTDVPEVLEFVTKTFQHMLVPHITAGMGEISLARAEGGHELHGRETIFLGGSALGPVFHFVKDEVRLQFMRSRADLMWLHAGASAKDGHAVLLSGMSGQGKSTITTLLSARGWSYMSDDIVPVRMENDYALPFPQTPSRRIHPGKEVSADEVAILPREAAMLDSSVIARGEARVRAIVFITYDAKSATTIDRLSQGESAFALLSNLTNFMDHRDSAVERAARIVKRVPMYSLRYSNPTSAADAISEGFKSVSS